MSPFDVTGALPTGTVVLEASAGTGKTWTIAALAARYLAEGVASIDQLMVVTFSRAATRELRSRVRARLVGTAAQLAGKVADPDLELADPVDRLLAGVEPAELTRRADRLARAVAEFDAATIATTHEFCQRMLAGLGVLVDHGADDDFVDDLSELTREVAADLYLTAYAGAEHPDLEFAEARQIAEAAIQHRDAVIVPDDESPRSRFARAVRTEVDRRKRHLGWYTFHDQQQRLADALADPVAAARLAERYPVALVDEFQDTDPVQWQILRDAFGGRSTLILIGDPKQAIYGFRGADVNSYLRAVREADAVYTLGTNYRSDARLVAALGTLAAGAELGHPEIAVREVAAAYETPRIEVAAPLALRVLRPGSREPVSALQRTITADLADQLCRLLRDPVRISGAAGDRALSAGDIAVLTQTNKTADEVTDALRRAGVPVARMGAGSVYASAEARDWEILLQTLAQPRARQIRRASLTAFGGWTVAELAGADDTRLADWTQQIRTWRRLLASHGVAALLEAIGETGLTERLLAVRGGARRLTDLRHIGQDLHAAQRSRQLGISGLIEWLTEQMQSAALRSEGRARRLDTDADAVQVMTVHAAKGLEFPVVALPDLWRSAKSMGGPQTRYDADGHRVLDVSPRQSAHPDRAAEDRGDALRRTYVALTRASRMVVCWWAWHDRSSPEAPLHRLLQRTDGAPPSHARPGVDPAAAPGFAVSYLDPAQPPARLNPITHPAPLAARRFTRELDLAWRRTSYSQLTSGAHDAAMRESEPPVRDEDEITPDDELASTTLAPTDPALQRPSPMAGLVAGAAFGTLTHEILERVDTSAADLPAAVRAGVVKRLTRLPIAGADADTLTEALLAVLATPLGPLAGGRTLAEFAPSDRLAELDFEYPLGGGDRPTHSSVVADIARALRRHVPAGDPLGGYADLLESQVGEETLRGWLTGSIDAVLRARDADGGIRHFVVDYKTNWLGAEPGEPLTLGHYVPPALASAMMAAHYPLQALLYCVALHRFLRWRLPGYRPDEHLGGVLYLFVRGMAGPDTPVIGGTPCGVFSWRPPSALILELSDLLHGGPTDAG